MKSSLVVMMPLSFGVIFSSPLVVKGFAATTTTRPARRGRRVVYHHHHHQRKHHIVPQHHGSPPIIQHVVLLLASANRNGDENVRYSARTRAFLDEEEVALLYSSASRSHHDEKTIDWLISQFLPPRGPIPTFRRKKHNSTCASTTITNTTALADNNNTKSVDDTMSGVSIMVDTMVTIDRLQRRRRRRGQGPTSKEWLLLPQENLNRLQTLLFRRLQQLEEEEDPLQTTTTTTTASDDDGDFSKPPLQQLGLVTKSLSPPQLGHLFRALVGSAGWMEQLPLTPPPPLHRCLLLTNVCARLRHGHILARLSPPILVSILHTLVVALSLSSSSSRSSTTNVFQSDYDAAAQEMETDHDGDVDDDENDDDAMMLLPLLPLFQLVQSVARRLRKQSVRDRTSTIHLLGALDAARKLWRWQQDNNNNSNDDDDDDDDDQLAGVDMPDMGRELQLLTYTLTQQVLSNVMMISVVEKDRDSININSTLKDNDATHIVDSSSSSRDAVASTSSLSSIWSPSRAAMVCRTAQQVLALCKNNDDYAEDDDPLVQQVCEALQKHSHHWHAAAVSDLAQILGALAHWQPAPGVLSDECIESLGHHFYSAIRDETKNNTGIHEKSESTVLCPGPSPSHVNTILRSVAFLGTRTAIPEPYLQAATHLFLNRSFLLQCTATELANFAWFTAFKAGGYWHTTFPTHADDHNHHRHKVPNALAQRILELDIVESCSPMLACRILNAFTELYCSNSKNDNDNAMLPSEMLPVSHEQKLLSNLFCSLGEPLLSTQLSPLDVSSAVYAYAKASYVLDMGIFDHLMEVMASRVTECTVRQVAQGLWACGKMAQWETCTHHTMEDGEDENDGTDWGHWIVEPPYLASAAQLARHLADCAAAELGPKDVAQALWALARLQLHSNATVVNALADRASEIAEQMNAQEVANSLWGLSRLTTFSNSNSHSRSGAILALTRRFTERPLHNNNNNNHPTSHSEILLLKPHEASSVLCALGRMNVRDEIVFGHLSQQMMDQIDTTSAQAIANALWAYRTVYLEPPPQLLNRWAHQKLGLVAVTPRDVGDYW